MKMESEDELWLTWWKDCPLLDFDARYYRLSSNLFGTHFFTITDKKIYRGNNDHDCKIKEYPKYIVYISKPGKFGNFLKKKIDDGNALIPLVKGAFYITYTEHVTRFNMNHVYDIQGLERTQHILKICNMKTRLANNVFTSSLVTAFLMEDDSIKFMHCNLKVKLGRLANVTKEKTGHGSLKCLGIKKDGKQCNNNSVELHRINPASEFYGRCRRHPRTSEEINGKLELIETDETLVGTRTVVHFYPSNFVFRTRGEPGVTYIHNNSANICQLTHINGINFKEHILRHEKCIIYLIICLRTCGFGRDIATYVAKICYYYNLYRFDYKLKEKDT